MWPLGPKTADDSHLSLIGGRFTSFFTYRKVLSKSALDLKITTYYQHISLTRMRVYDLSVVKE